MPADQPPKLGRPAADTTTIDSPGPRPDPAAAALAFALQVLGLAADPAQITHQVGKVPLEEGDLLRAARHFPIKVRAQNSSFARLLGTPLPAIARARDGRWLVIGRVGED